MNSLQLSLLLGFLAGAAIPFGALLARFEHIQPKWLKKEFRHSVIAFGGGALLAAVSFVLVPEGIKDIPTLTVMVVFSLGGVTFFLLDGLVARSKRSMGQFFAMLLDFLPEALALGSAFALSQDFGFLLAFLIGLQNLPEGFNAFRELKKNKNFSSSKILSLFSMISLLGPIFVYLGHEVLVGYPVAMRLIMLFAAGGIIYAVFEDIAPKVTLKNHGAPALGALLGFLLGLIGHILIVGYHPLTGR